MKLIFKLLFLCLQFGIFEITVSQELLVPASFVQIESAGSNLKAQIAEARRRFQLQSKGDRFWVGFALTIRDGIEFDDLYIHDGGGITISRGGKGGIFIDDEDRFDFGEEAESAAEKRQIISHFGDQLAVFYQFEVNNLQLKKIKAYNSYRKRGFRNESGFWLTEVSNDDSFNYLTDIVNDQIYNKKIIEPSLCLLSLHDHPQVVPLLARIAGGEQHLEIRKSAAFWLGQVPLEESFAALVQLFDKEEKFELKEHLVFAISQHRSENVIRQLEKIARGNEDFDIREKAIFWLGQTNREDALDILVNLMKTGSSSELKEKIVFSISQHKSERAVTLLIEVADAERDRDVRKQAIFWLGQIASKKTLHALGDIVESTEDTEAKEQAVFAISQHADKDEAFDMLMDIAKHNPNPEVRKKAIFWLSQTDDERAVDFFKEILTN
ncbi:MAG TPA: HEAT repeat domain-containing protein [bacterium]